nr:PE-PGRS family protein PE_PGRS3-like [Kogia breviceps]
MGALRRMLFHVGEEPWAASVRQAGGQRGVGPKKGGALANGRNRATIGVTSKWLFSKKVSGKTELGRAHWRERSGGGVGAGRARVLTERAGGGAERSGRPTRVAAGAGGAAGAGVAGGGGPGAAGPEGARVGVGGGRSRAVPAPTGRPLRDGVCQRSSSSSAGPHTRRRGPSAVRGRRAARDTKNARAAGAGRLRLPAAPARQPVPTRRLRRPAPARELVVRGRGAGKSLRRVRWGPDQRGLRGASSAGPRGCSCATIAPSRFRTGLGSRFFLGLSARGQITKRRAGTLRCVRSHPSAPREGTCQPHVFRHAYVKVALSEKSITHHFYLKRLTTWPALAAPLEVVGPSWVQSQAQDEVAGAPAAPSCPPDSV